MFTSLTGFIARETEKAIGLANGESRANVKLLWIPRAKVDSMVELDSPSIAIQIAGDQAQHSATPVKIEIDTAFLQKIGVLPK